MGVQENMDYINLEGIGGFSWRGYDISDEPQRRTLTCKVKTKK
jgi:hypothetical protein